MAPAPTHPPAAPGAVASLRRDAAAFLLLATVALVAYWPALHGAMLWDDDAHLTPPWLASCSGLWRLWSEPAASQQYYPVVGTAFWLMNKLWGHAPLGYHVVNVLLHSLSAVLVAGLLRRWSVPGAWLVAILFLLHPVHVESVAWMSELKNTLSGVCYLLALRSWCTFDATRRRGAYGSALLWFLLALGSKSVTATLPAAALVIVWWRRGRVDLRRDVVPLLPFFALGLAAGLGTAWLEYTQVGAQGDEFGLGPLERLLLAGRALCFYAAKLVWPHPLVFSYARWDLDAAAWWQWSFPITVFAVLLVAWLWRRRSRAPLAALLWFAGTLTPALGFVNVYPFRFSYVADHFQYLASLAVLTLAGAGLARLRLPLVAVAAGITLPLATLTFVQSRQYAHAETLYRTTIAANPASMLAHNNLASLLLGGPESGWAEALLLAERAVVLGPRDAGAHSNLGLALHRLGREPDAERALRRAIELDERLPEAHHNLGAVLAAQDRPGDAVVSYQRALALRPDAPVVLADLAVVWQQLGRLPDAIAAQRRAAELQPAPATWLNLGNLLQAAGSFDAAIAAYQQALALAPDWADALMNVAVAHARAGRAEAAVAAFEAADRAAPGSFAVLHNLGKLLTSMGRIEAAITTGERALAVAPPELAAELHDQFGAWLLQLGRPAAAIPHFEAALRLRPDFASARQHLEQARGR